jgi:hypothetical protein
LEDYSLKTDFRSLSPYDMSSWFKIYEALSVGGMQKIILNSPAGQMFLKDGGRIPNAMNSVLRFMGARADIDETPESLWQATKAVSQVLSGVSNFTKARLILETGQILDQKGKLVASGLGTQSAIFQMFGFPPSSAADLYDSITKTNDDVKAHKDAVTKDYNEITRYYKESLELDNTDAVFRDKLVNTILRTYKNDLKGMEIMNGLMQRDLEDTTSTMYKLFNKRIAIAHINPGEFRTQIKSWPVSDEYKEIMLERLDDVVNANKGNE